MKSFIALFLISFVSTANGSTKENYLNRLTGSITHSQLEKKIQSIVNNYSDYEVFKVLKILSEHVSLKCLIAKTPGMKLTAKSITQTVVFSQNLSSTPYLLEVYVDKLCTLIKQNLVRHEEIIKNIHFFYPFKTEILVNQLQYPHLNNNYENWQNFVLRIFGTHTSPAELRS